MKRVVCVCATCGSTEVYQDAWVSMNNPGELLGPYDTMHCEQCEDECDVVEKVYVEVPVEMLDAFVDYTRNATLEGDPIPAFVTDAEKILEAK